MSRSVAGLALAARGALVALAALVVSCRSDGPRAGRWVTCNCPYLTDFDDVAKHSVDVCVPPGADATELGRDCAARVAHGPPDACKCEGPREPCDGREACRSNELK